MFVNSGRAELAHEITGFSDGAECLNRVAGLVLKFVEAQRAGYRHSPTGMSHQ
jgi:hypothetical protein